MTNKAAIVSGASFLKTPVIWSISTKPSATTRQSTVKAITSGAAHTEGTATEVVARLTSVVTFLSGNET